MAIHTRQAGVEISASTTTASATIPANNSYQYIRVVNGTSAIAYVTTGKGSATATNASQAVPPNWYAIMIKPSDDDTVAVILSTGTGKVSVAPCDGTL